jgi:hypothetical protein
LRGENGSGVRILEFCAWMLGAQRFTAGSQNDGGLLGTFATCLDPVVVLERSVADLGAVVHALVVPEMVLEDLRKLRNA